MFSTVYKNNRAPFNPILDSYSFFFGPVFLDFYTFMHSLFILQKATRYGKTSSQSPYYLTANLPILSLFTINFISPT